MAGLGLGRARGLGTLARNPPMHGPSPTPTRCRPRPPPPRARAVDIESVDALIQGLQLFKGGVLMISHDESLLANAADELWIAPGDGTLSVWKGSFAEYKRSYLASLKR